jgi:hypothetical protein
MAPGAAITSPDGPLRVDVMTSTESLRVYGWNLGAPARVSRPVGPTRGPTSSAETWAYAEPCFRLALEIRRPFGTGARTGAFALGTPVAQATRRRRGARLDGPRVAAVGDGPRRRVPSAAG